MTCAKSCKATCRFIVILTTALLVAGCESNPTRDAVCEVQVVEVKVPVPVRMTPTPELLAAPQFADGLPVWLEPTDPQASSALTREGETRLRLQLQEMQDRDEAWREWATGQ